MHPRAVIKHKKGFGQQGFTLAETAIALAVIAIVIGALVPTFLSIRVAEQSRATAQNLQSAMRAVAAFVHSAGCLPCPTDVMNGTAGWGIVRGDTRDNPPSCAACEHAVGHLPFCSLGLPESFAKDAYGHWLTYAVDTRLASFVAEGSNTQLPVFGTTGFCNSSVMPTNALTVAISNGQPQKNIAVMILSHGANGRGAYVNVQQSDINIERLPFPNTVPTCSIADQTGAERCNARGKDNTQFVAALPAQGADPFDDVMLYFDRNALVTYLGNKPCETEWK